MSESGTKPSDEMAWASAPAGVDVVTPSAAQEAAGYVYNQILPHDEFNYILKNFTDWISYFHAGRPRIFSDLYSLCTTLAEGQTGIVADLNYTNSHESPGRDYTLGAAATENWTGTAASSDASFSSPICTDGKYVYIATTTSIDEYNEVSSYSSKYLLAIDISTWNVAWSVGKLTSDGSVDHTAVACDGQHVFLSQNSEIFKLDPSDGSAVAAWSGVDHGANIHAIYADGQTVFIAGAVSSSLTHKALNYTNGSVTASGNHTADVYAIVGDGDFIYIGGDEATSSGPLVRKLHYGTLAAVEEDFDYDTGGSATEITWDTPGAGTPHVRALALSKEVLYVGGKSENGTPLVAALTIEGGGALTTLWDMNQSADIYLDLGTPAPDTTGKFGDVVSLVLDPSGYLWVGTIGGSSNGTEDVKLLQQVGASDGGVLKAIDLGLTNVDNYSFYRCYSCSDGFRLYSIVGKGGGVSGAGDGTEQKARLQSRTLRRAPTLVSRVSSGRYRPFMGLAVSHLNEDK